MDAKEGRQLLRMLRQVVARLEQISIEPGGGPACKTCGFNLRCVHCMGSEGGRKQNQMYDKPTKSKWGRKGGRPPKKKVIVDLTTGAVVPLTPKSTPTAAAPPIPADSNPQSQESGIDPAKFYKADEVALLIGVHLDTMRHWRTAKRGPRYHKFDGHFIRYSGKDLLEWLSRSRHYALTEELDSDGARKAEPNL
jgi:hypothetical protein